MLQYYCRFVAIVQYVFTIHRFPDNTHV